MVRLLHKQASIEPNGDELDAEYDEDDDEAMTTPKMVMGVNRGYNMCVQTYI